MPVTERLPVITVAEYTVLGLRDVLRSDGMLRITSRNLLFDRRDPVSHCLIKDTRSKGHMLVQFDAITFIPDPQERPMSRSKRHLSFFCGCFAALKGTMPAFPT
ncbi:MAG: hypothetical protein Q3M24_08150 [Candidatus Electrothrix aestuarii]|nr:hypothetical protein [Candidatus Electrothrix aestuarii]